MSESSRRVEHGRAPYWGGVAKPNLQTNLAQSGGALSVDCPLGGGYCIRGGSTNLARCRLPAFDTLRRMNSPFPAVVREPLNGIDDPTVVQFRTRHPPPLP
jgi:hypothetical protein